MRQKLLPALIIISVFLTLPFFGKLPIPADSIPGLYYPMRDIPYGYPNGVPTKNPLITDPVRQQFAWKYLAVEQFKKLNWPLWNPYNFSGTPLLANFQTAAFYPLNIIFLIPIPQSIICLFYNSVCQTNQVGPSLQIMQFALQWSYFIYLQTILSFLFMFLYLRKIGLTSIAAVFGSVSWTFCGFVTAWWEWGNVVHTLLYFPIILYAIELIIEEDPVRVFEQQAIPKSLIRAFMHISVNKLILLSALTASFFAGHLQTFFLVAINTFFYIFYKIPVIYFDNSQTYPTTRFRIEFTHRRLFYWLQFLQIAFIFLLLSSIQLLPTLDFVQQSARNVELQSWKRLDWFYPFEHFVGLISPDYFGNPATYNYWGVWNYGEFAVYIGIIPLLFALSAIIQFVGDVLRKIIPRIRLRLKHSDRISESLDLMVVNTGAGFFVFALLINLILITRNPLTTLAYSMQIPFLTTTQPSRGVAIVDFALIILASISFNQLVKAVGQKKLEQSEFSHNKAHLNFAYIFLAIIIVSLWYITFTRNSLLLGVLEKIPDQDVFTVSKSNLILPTILTLFSIILVRVIYKSLEKIYAQNEELQTSASAQSGRFNIHNTLLYFLIALTLLDLGRFFFKFTAFSPPQFLYPQMPMFNKLTEGEISRYMTENSQIIAPNINIPYKIQSVEGYDPLYLDQYGQLIGLWTREKPDLSPYKVNRIISPQIPKSIIADISAVSHILSFGDYTVYHKEAQFGQTKLFKRNTALSRVAIIPNVRGFSNNKDLAEYLFSNSFNPHQEILALIPQRDDLTVPKEGIQVKLGSFDNQVRITEYSPNQVKVSADLYDAPGLLYLADTYESGWKAKVDGQEATIIKANFNFRALQLERGTHTIEMYYQPDSFNWGLGLTAFGIVFVFLVGISIRKNRKI